MLNFAKLRERAEEDKKLLQEAAIKKGIDLLEDRQQEFETELYFAMIENKTVYRLDRWIAMLQKNNIPNWLAYESVKRFLGVDEIKCNSNGAYIEL